MANLVPNCVRPTARFHLTVSLLVLALAALGAARKEPAAELALSPMWGMIGKTLIRDEKHTLLDVAYDHRLGYEAVKRLNPSVDPWIPLPGTVVLLPTQYILPHVDPEGLVINIPEMRLYDFTVREGPPEVFALAIGDMADPSILGDFRVGEKRKDPVWTVPKSIREEEPHLPAAVPPGPDNPLGSRWMRVGNTSYGIHGTDVRWSIGRQATHGCLRLYEDEIQRLYARIPRGTRLQIVYQIAKWSREGRHLYVEAHPDPYGLRPDRLTTALEVPRTQGFLRWVHFPSLRAALEQAQGVPVVVGTLPPESSD